MSEGTHPDPIYGIAVPDEAVEPIPPSSRGRATNCLPTPEVARRFRPYGRDRRDAGAWRRRSPNQEG